MPTNIFFTSDTHYQHKKIIEYCNRPFKDMQDMEDSLVDNWNAMVGKDDTVYHLGDFAMRGECLDRYAPRLNGVKRLIRGNHDMESTNRYIKHGFREIYGSLVRGHLLLTHYPVHPDSIGKHLANVHGHIHANKGPAGRYINVSVEVVDYKPVLLDQLISQAEVLKAQEEALA